MKAFRCDMCERLYTHEDLVEHLNKDYMTYEITKVNRDIDIDEGKFNFEKVHLNLCPNCKKIIAGLFNNPK